MASENELVTLENIMAGSHEGYIESYVNASFNDVDNPQWTPFSWATSVFTYILVVCVIHRF